ncbi:unnamed protein product [Oncorhynchus mykiss]|uniref:IMD domain-containing protein n=1 Tax=Oncorhynchus mykiss TaxID=8022 RepID=A0A060XH01_ONCMY|nr:unnamed protein product [Oncorhynchus mykiss]
MSLRTCCIRNVFVCTPRPHMFLFYVLRAVTQCGMTSSARPGSYNHSSVIGLEIHVDIPVERESTSMHALAVCDLAREPVRRFRQPSIICTGELQIVITYYETRSFFNRLCLTACVVGLVSGGTRDIGSALTRMCMRHRSIEAKLRQFSMVFIDCLINPLQDQMEEWKRVANTLDKDHAKEYKKARQEIKKKSSDTLKLQKKAKKGRVTLRMPELTTLTFEAKSDFGGWRKETKVLILNSTKIHLILSQVTCQRVRILPLCHGSLLTSVDLSHLCVVSSLSPHSMYPVTLSTGLFHIVRCPNSFNVPWHRFYKCLELYWRMRHHSSTINSIISFFTSTSSSLAISETCQPVSEGSSSSSSSSSPASSKETCSSTRVEQVNTRLDTHRHVQNTSSVIRHECYKNPISFSPFSSVSCVMNTTELSELHNRAELFLVGIAQELCLSDWAKPGPYDQPMVNTLRRTKEKRETPDPSSPQATTPGDEPQRAKGTNAVIQRLYVLICVCLQEEAEAHEELALALARGLQLDIQRSSRDSLQCSSGYSTQNTTPCCSEDTIPSQVSDYDYFSVGGDQETDQPDFDKSSTIPRNSDISQSYRRMFHAKRPASTAGIPTTAPSPASIVTPGVATIRRTPSSKPNLRRPSGSLGLGPIPVKPPMIPVKTPTVPEHPGVFFRGESEGGGPLSPRSPLSSAGDNGLLVSPKATWDTQAPSDPPTSPPQSGKVQEEEPGCGEGEDVLLAIRRGVKLKKTASNDRSAPRIV